MLALLLVLTITCVVVSCLIGALALLDPARKLSKSIMILALISVSATYIVALPSGIALPWAYERVFEFLAIPNAGLLWWWALSLLKDDFRLDRFAWLGVLVGSAGYGLAWLGNMGHALVEPAVLLRLINLGPALLILHILWTAVAGRRADLVEPRRKARIWLAVLPALALAGVFLSDYILDDTGQRLLRVVLALPVTLTIMFWLLRFDVSALSFAGKTGLEPDAPKINPRDIVAHDRLMRIMEEERAYLEPDMSIGRLAERVGVPPHRLRAIINQGLGYRNFHMFLSHYRIEHVKAELADPDKARVPILTLALEGGYASLATFNRAFKAKTGQTASAYRKAALSG